MWSSHGISGVCPRLDGAIGIMFTIHESDENNNCVPYYISDPFVLIIYINDTHYFTRGASAL